ncbi:acetolactate synthase small subunit [Zongyangia hominis]|uniref:Acetolactate synthase small subunit n=1 Tax=Zongyangia hominis TaxID=2763677 RepID=A0A926EEA5_9FIRM|nr:acetolactate synthase small subunit [Zongyangia hominis]MBC8570516.1 acetolactate synthase small subunit [Zongyangia hominis]
MMKHTISVLVENHSGVLSRISGLFSRRGFNIDSLAVGVTEDPSISRMTIVVDGNDYTVEQVEKQLNKLIDVIKVRTIPSEELVTRELVLVKVQVETSQRSEVMDLVKIMGGKIIDISRTTLTIEMTDTTAQIALLEDLLSPYRVVEVARTGLIAVQKGAVTIHKK